MDVIGRYEETPFLRTRLAHVDTLDQGHRKHHIPILLEVDVTHPRARMRNLEARTGEAPSFTGWIVACLARAVAEHPRVHAMRRGALSLVTFQDVDVSIVVERAVTRRPSGETLPMPYVLRRANEKDVWAMHRVIRQAQARPVEPAEAVLGGRRLGRLTDLFFRLPRTLRAWLVFRRLVDDRFFAKRLMGTVVVTSIGTAGLGGGSVWAIPTGIHPLVLAIGAIARKPALVGQATEARELLDLTLLFDHDVVDGAPVARFLGRLREVLEGGYGLADQDVTPAPHDDHGARVPGPAPGSSARRREDRNQPLSPSLDGRRGRGSGPTLSAEGAGSVATSARRYRIRVRSQLGPDWSGCFDDFTVRTELNGDTTLEGRVLDRAVLHGLPACIRDLGLPLLALEEMLPVPAAPPDDDTPASEGTRAR
jgi:hypothetical protein